MNRPDLRGALFLPALAVLATACSGGGDGPATAKTPRSAGDVFEIATPEDRETVPASVLAFVTGLHVMVRDGDRVYAGQTRLDLERQPDGARALTLGNGLTAQLVEEGDGFQLRFSTGETVMMRKQPDQGDK
jgi:hypothetical protein